jgi:glycosyltransferase involved in cell wall biosynthesis
MRRVRVLQVIDTLGMGGAETWLMEVLRLWARSGAAEMDLLLTSGNRGIFDEEAQRLGAKLYYASYTRRRLAQFVPAFRRILRHGRYDAIHDHQDYSAGWHFLMGSGTLPLIRVVHVHNPSFGIRHTYGISRSRATTAAVGRLLVGCYATHLTGTSRQILTEWGFDAPAYRSLPKAALYCGFDPGRFSGDIRAAKESLCREFRWPEDSKIVLVAGRMDESPDLGHLRNHKNTGFAVDVAIACMKSDPRVRALFVGKITQALTTLDLRIAEAGLIGRFAFPGVRTDIEIMMLGADTLLFPSRGEGLGMVAVEAQAAGLPVLASTAVPQECVVIPDLVEFRDVEDGPGPWAAQLLRLIALPRDVASANRRVAASAFSIERSARNLFDLYSAGFLPPDGNLLPQQA